MSHMGDVLAGFHAVWEFDTDSVLIRFERGIRRPKLFQALGERRIPYEALSAVEVTEGRRGTVVLHAVPRHGADPLMEAANGQLKDDSDPYRLVLPAERETLAEYYADELRTALGPDAKEPADRHLVAAPEPPLHFKAYDGKASFDGRSVAFRWFWTGASSAKWKCGDQTFPVGELAGIEWRSPEILNGYLRLLARGARDGGADEADQDPAAVVFGWDTAPCMSRCRSRPRCCRPSAPPSRRRRRRTANRCAAGPGTRAGTRRTSRTASGTSANCTSPVC